MSLFQAGDFILHSGMKSKWKIDCDALTPDDWKALAVILMEKYAVAKMTFSAVEGVPTGGLAFAKALEPYCTPGSPLTLVVDDVWTTGESWKTQCKRRANVLGAVVFARQPLKDWRMTCLFRMY